MKYILSLLFICTVCGCKDSNTHRYFYFHYSMSEKDGNQGGTGDYWLSYDSFPSKNYIDSAVYGDLPKKRECYQPLEIDFFFEFKSKEDFDAFRRNYHGNASPIKNKLSCCCWPFSIITIDSVGQITYDSLIIEK